MFENWFTKSDPVQVECKACDGAGIQLLIPKKQR